MRLKLLAPALALVLVTGCGPDSSSPGTSSNGGGGTGTAARNPCELLTSAELGTIVSTVDKLAAPPAITQDGPVGEFQGRKCTWSYPRPEVVTDTAEISVTAWHGLEYYTPDVTGGFTAVPGIGDAAHVRPACSCSARARMSSWSRSSATRTSTPCVQPSPRPSLRSSDPAPPSYWPPERRATTPCWVEDSGRYRGNRRSSGAHDCITRCLRGLRCAHDDRAALLRRRPVV